MKVKKRKMGGGMVRIKKGAERLRVRAKTGTVVKEKYGCG
jgi:hypothetical protein